MTDDTSSRHFIDPELRRPVLPAADRVPPIDPRAPVSDVASQARDVLGGAESPAALAAQAPAAIPSEAVLAPSPDVTWTMLDAEAVLLDLESGSYFTLNRTATALWQLLDGRRPFGDVVAQLLDRFDIDAQSARTQLGALVGNLLRLRLVRRIDRGG